MAKVRKRNGTLQTFNKNKIVKACKKAGASAKSAMMVAEEVAKKVGEGTVRAERLSKLVITTLRRKNKRAAASFAAYVKKKYLKKR
ncbi:MAG: hypothetical protein HYS62_01420 [Candidatus Aenigmarchaeota archaeon]|nr:hypothetical protein [Candidatus Aenigmarchaeota archaeon]